MRYNFPYIELAWHDAVVQYYLETFKTYKFDNFFLRRAREKKKKVLFLNLILFLKIYVLLYIVKKIIFFFSKIRRGGGQNLFFLLFHFLSQNPYKHFPDSKNSKGKLIYKTYTSVCVFTWEVFKKIPFKKKKKKKKKKKMGPFGPHFFLFLGM